jgi:hypothetical protein
MAYVDLKKTPMEQEEKANPSVAQENVYPYGCSFSFDDETLSKLGLDCEDEDCQVGNYLEFKVLAEVTGHNSHDTGAGKKHCLNLQATHIDLIGDGAEESHEEPDGDEGEGRVIRASGYY